MARYFLLYSESVLFRWLVSGRPVAPLRFINFRAHKAQPRAANKHFPFPSHTPKYERKKMKTTVSEPADDQRHFPTCRKKTSKIHDSCVRKMILPSFFIIFSGLFDKIHNIRIDLGGESKDLCFFHFSSKIML